MRPPPIFLALTLLFWLGLYALRTYIPAAVWNLSDELPLNMKPMLPLAVNVVAVGGVFFFRNAQRRALLVLAIVFAALTVARQAFNTVDAVGPWLAQLAWILLVWFAAVLAEEAVRLRAERWVAPAFATAFALQVGMQSAGHGLELASMNGSAAIIIITLLSALLVISVLRIERSEQVETAQRSSVVWLLLGPALFLLATLSANVGRVSELTALPFPLAALGVQAGLLIGLVAAGRRMPAALRIAILVIALAAALYALVLRGTWGLLLPTVSIAVLAGMDNATLRMVRWRASTSIAGAAILAFALLSGFYYVYEFTPLWPLTLILFLTALALPWHAQTPDLRRVALPAAVAVLLTPAYFLTRATPQIALESDELVVLSYNIHHGFDDDGVPGMQRIAAEIRAANADLVALQEVSRGWTLLGGNDLVSYLRWRFPEYEIVFRATDGQLWGNAIMSRLPLSAAAGGTFDAEPGVLRYGWVQAMIHLPDRHLEFYSVHLTADLESRGGDPRLPQAQRLIEQVGAAPMVIVAGDFNAHPEDPPIRALREALTDLGEQAGLAQQPTWPAADPRERIDYIFGRAVTVTDGAVLATTASDHRPILVRVRTVDATARATTSSNLHFVRTGE